jgi:hypothetical protein
MAVARVVRAFTWIIYEPRSFLGVILSVTWACGPPIEMKINHGGTEITEKTLKKLKLRALRGEWFLTERGAQRGVKGPLWPTGISDLLLRHAATL